jgi:uncharacterized protein (DUF1778 family)
MPLALRPCHWKRLGVEYLDMYACVTYMRLDISPRRPPMLAFHDEAKQVEERNEARMNFRTKPRIKSAIQKAAALSGVDDSVFTMNAAYQAALATIAAHERTHLEPVDHEAFFAVLDAPPAPTKALRAAFRRHRETVGT